MNTVALDVDSFETSVFSRNESASLIGSTFEAVQNGISTVLFCSDCCGSNGNSCDPNNTPVYPPM